LAFASFDPLWLPYDARMVLTRPASPHRLPAIVAGAGLVLVLGACGSDAADITDDTTSATTATEETSQTSPPEPTEPTETTDAPSGDSIDGEGYTYAIPDGWEDVSDEAASAQADSAVRVTDSAGGFGTNINVIVSPSGGVTDIESLRDQFKQQIEGLVDTPVEEIDNITIAGETAIGQTASAKQQGDTLMFTQYFVAHEDSIYAVTLTAPEADAENGRAALDSIISSWAWE